MRNRNESTDKIAFHIDTFTRKANPDYSVSHENEKRCYDFRVRSKCILLKLLKTLYILRHIVSVTTFQYGFVEEKQEKSYNYDHKRMFCVFSLTFRLVNVDCNSTCLCFCQKAVSSSGTFRPSRLTLAETRF